jgi:hypothetical protein
MARTGCLVCFISTVNGCSKKEEKKAIKTALVVGTQQTLSNLFREFQYLWSGANTTKPFFPNARGI